MVQQNYRPDFTRLDPSLNRIRLTRSEFEAAEGTPGYHYELIEGVLHVSPAPSPNEKEITVELYELLKRHQQGRSPAPFEKVLWEPRLMISTAEQSTTNPEPDIAVYETYRRTPENSYSEINPILVIEVVDVDGFDKDFVRNVELYARVPTVREYWVVDPRRNPQRPSMAVFHRSDGVSRFERMDVPAGGVYEPQRWPGLKIDLTQIGVKF